MYYWIYRRLNKKNGSEYIWKRHAVHVSPNIEPYLGKGYENAIQYANELREQTGKLYVAVAIPESAKAPDRCIMSLDVYQANGII